MRRPNLLQVGIVGSAVAALCCFTAVLVVLLGASASPRSPPWWQSPAW